MSGDAGYDLVIIGGGLAGLSLGERLAAQTSPPNTLIIEPREHYCSDRTWSFWAPSNHRLSHLVKKQWTKTSYGCLNGPSELLHHQETPYQTIASDDFYRWSTKHIKQHSRVELSLGESLIDFDIIDERYLLKTSKRTVYSTHVVDTRPPSDATFDKSQMYQCFIGHHVVLQQALDETTAELMTDMHCDEHGFIFTYVLPLSTHEAIIEVTRFSTSQTPWAILQDDLQALINRRGWIIQHTPHKEQARLPMGLPAPETKPGTVSTAKGVWVTAGTAGGALRPSSGYGFLRIQRWASDCAQSIEQCHFPIAHPPQHSVLAWMDRIFLRVLARYPNLTPQLFFSLYRKAATPRLIRFMNDEASLVDCLSVMAALPSGPFLSRLIK